MNEKTLFAGFGGQGIISLGQIWVYCGMKEGKEVCFYPFYGAEKRGGIARANCIISDDAIASPIVSKASSCVVMNGDSLSVCVESLAEGGLLLVNSSLVSDSDIDAAGKDIRKRFRVVTVGATGIADSLGNVRFANMVMLGALARATGALHLKTLEAIFEGFFTGSKAKFIPMNLSAVREGEKAVK